jgi:hypothetical protein
MAASSTTHSSTTENTILKDKSASAYLSALEA